MVHVHIIFKIIGIPFNRQNTNQTISKWHVQLCQMIQLCSQVDLCPCESWELANVLDAIGNFRNIYFICTGIIYYVWTGNTGKCKRNLSDTDVNSCAPMVFIKEVMEEPCPRLPE